jgi:hypothetical protein
MESNHAEMVAQLCAIIVATEKQAEFFLEPPGQGQKRKQQWSFFSLRHHHSVGH